MNLDDLRIFSAVAQQRSFSGAAKVLAMPTATVSRRLSVLEKDLGQLLIHRSTRSVEVSEFGKGLFARVIPLLEEFEQIEEDTEKALGRVSGKLTIQIPQDLFADNLISCLQGFMNLYPDIRLRCREYLGWSHKAPEDYDLTLLCFELNLPDSNWVAQPLLSLNQGIFANPTLADQFKIGGKSAKKFVSSVPIISRYEENHWYFRNAGKTEPVALDPYLKLDSLSQQIKASVNGLGFIKAPFSAVSEQLKNRTLVEIPLKSNPAALSVSLFYKSRFQPKRVSVFMDYLQRFLAS